MSCDQLPGEPAPDHPVFGIEPSLDTDRGTVRLTGELDIASTGRLEVVLDQLRHQGYRNLVLDLSELEFLSATGLSVLVHAASEYADAGGRLTLTRPTQFVRRILAAADLECLLASPTADAPG